MEVGVTPEGRVKLSKAGSFFISSNKSVGLLVLFFIFATAVWLSSKSM